MATRGISIEEKRGGVDTIEPINQETLSLRALRFFKQMVYTMLFCAFFIVTALMTWQVSRLFLDDSYKMTALFIGLILISNVTAKYIIWSLKN